MHAKHIVKGNFMTLSAKPKTLEQGEWVAHQGELRETLPNCSGAKHYSGRALPQPLAICSCHP